MCHYTEHMRHRITYITWDTEISHVLLHWTHEPQNIRYRSILCVIVRNIWDTEIHISHEIQKYLMCYFAEHMRLGIWVIEVQPIAFGVSFNLNLQSQSHWSLFDGTWQTRPRELEYWSRFEIEEWHSKCNRLYLICYSTQHMRHRSIYITCDTEVTHVSVNGTQKFLTCPAEWSEQFLAFSWILQNGENTFWFILFRWWFASRLKSLCILRVCIYMWKLALMY